MLRIQVSSSSEGAKKYFNEALEKGDYYLEGQEILGQWGGEGAKLLGLDGEVTKEAFHALCDNQDPRTQGSLTARDKENRRVGYDFNFNCPKGVSLAYELNHDESILKVFRDSVRETMQELEKDMKARVRAKNQNADRVTGNIVYGEFIHKTSRPEKGVPDPHLHAHCFVFNATHDPIENIWKAGQFGDIKRDAPYYEAAFHARLALKVKELGFEVEKQGKFWDIAGISKETKDKFSNRTLRIENIAKEQGITNAKEKDKLGALSREKKNPTLTNETLALKWTERLTQEEKDRLKSLKNNPEMTQKVNLLFTEERAMKFAIADAFERKSICSEKLLRAEALRYGVGTVTVEGVRRQTFQEEIIRTEDDSGQVVLTHKKVLEEEKEMIAFTKEGMGECYALSPSWEIQNEKVKNSPEQAQALLHICESKDQVIALTGQAGTGKTTLMQETIQAIESKGHKVFVFAPSSAASRGVLREEGFKNAETVDHLLANEQAQAKLKNQVLWIDEAGLLGAKSMNQIFKLAKDKNCRVILSGDSGQHHAVQRGDALRILEGHAGLKPAYLTEIFRQKDNKQYKKAISHIRNQEFDQAFQVLGEMGSIQEIKGEEERGAALADQYLKSARTHRSVLVVSPTHTESDRVTEAIRDQLKKSAEISSEDHTQTRLQNLSWKNAQKLDPRNYEKDMVIKFHQNKPGIKRGEAWSVDQVDRNSGEIKIRNGEREFSLPMKEPGHFQVYLKKEIFLAKGDRVRITENSYSKEKKRLNNGDLKTITEIKKTGEMVLNGKYTLPKEFGHLTHGYCVTSHASQGKTVDCVIVAESEDSLAAASMEQFYVSLSRGRKQALIFTHDKNELMKAVGRMDQRLSAHDIQSKVQEPEKAKKPKVKEVVPELLRRPPAMKRERGRGISLER